MVKANNVKRLRKQGELRRELKEKATTKILAKYIDKKLRVILTANTDKRTKINKVCRIFSGTGMHEFLDSVEDRVTVAKQEGLQKEYQQFFMDKLKNWGANSPQDLNDNQKEEFFDQVEREWTGEKTEG